MILQNLDGHDLISSTLPAFRDLSKCSPAEELQNLVAVGDGAEDLVLHQLVVALTVGVAALGGGRGMSDGQSSGIASTSSHTVGEHRSRQLLQNLHAVAAVHLLTFPLQTALFLITHTCQRGGACIFSTLTGCG